MDDNNTSEKEIEVINGDGSELNLSPVYEHLTSLKPKTKENNKKKIIIPEVKKKNNDPKPPTA